jgi:hypothetical protein
MNQKPVLLFNFRCVAHLYSRNNYQPFSGQIPDEKQKKYIAFYNLSAKHSFIQLIVFIFFGVITTSCHSNTTPQEVLLPSNDSSIFYPANEYFVTQILHVDSLANITYTYTDSDNRKDSSLITVSQFKELAKPFLIDDINDTRIKKYYKESIFNDVSTGSNTFTYTSVNKDLPLQTIDILLDTSTDVVKRVFITKNFVKGDSAITEKIGWKTDQSFTITRLMQLPDKKETTQQINVLWSRNN